MVTVSPALYFAADIVVPANELLWKAKSQIEITIKEIDSRLHGIIFITPLLGLS
jgi:hypothetical protein